jgi:hypothetical protein
MRSERKQDIIMWSALGAYLVVWIALSLYLLGDAFWPLGLTVGLAYVAGHVITILWRGRCYLESDPAAVPLALFALLAAVAVLHIFDAQPQMPAAKRWIAYFQLFIFSYVGGHIAAIGYSALMDKLIPEWLFIRKPKLPEE